MNRWLLGAAMIAAIGATPASAELGIEVFDNATLIDSVSGIVTGNASLTTNDAAFSNVTVNVQGAPILPHADLSTVTLDATSAAGFVGTHTLTIDVFQTAVSGHGSTQSTFTINGLINDPGPTTESTFQGGTATTLGSLLATHTFAVGDLDDHAGPITIGAGAFTADAIAYGIGFTAADQSFGGSAELTTNVPEPRTWALMALGFGVLALIGIRRRHDRLATI